MGAVSRALQNPLRLGHSHASMAAALALHGFAGAASEHPQWGCADAPSGLEPGGNLPLYIMANFYTDHPEIPAAEEKYFVKKNSSETECKQERDLV